MEKILDDLNNILNIFYSSIKSQGYDFINKISIISPEIFEKEPLKSIFISKNFNNMILILNVIISGIILYYVFKSIISLYSSTSINNIYYFIIKIIIISIISSNSLYICKEVININYVFSDTIKTFLEEVSNKKIDYSFLEDNISTLDDFFNLADKGGINGLKDMIICIYILALIIFFSIRYVVINLCIIISPFIFLCLVSNKSKFIFYFWLKIFVFNLIIQIVNYIVIYVPVVSKKEDVYIPILIGSVIIMFKICQVVGDLKLYGKN